MDKYKASIKRYNGLLKTLSIYIRTNTEYDPTRSENPVEGGRGIEARSKDGDQRRRGGSNDRYHQEPRGENKKHAVLVSTFALVRSSTVIVHLNHSKGGSTLTGYSRESCSVRVETRSCNRAVAGSSLPSMQTDGLEKSGITQHDSRLVQDSVHNSLRS